MVVGVPNGEGTIPEYVQDVSGQATGVRPDVIAALKSLPAASVITDILLPIRIHEERISIPRLRRLRAVLFTWQEEDIARRGEFFRTLTAFPPLASDDLDLPKEGEDSDLIRDGRIIRFISLLFSREELLQGLASFQPDLEQPNEPSLTAIRRIARALRDNIFVQMDADLTERQEERAAMVTVLAPFISSPVLSDRARTDIAESVVEATPKEGHDDEVPTVFWWRALASNNPDISRRASRRIARIIDSQQTESIAEIERLVDETEITYKNFDIFLNFNKAMESLSFIPEQHADGIFRILMGKVAAMEIKPEAKYRLNLVSVCSSMNTLLYYAHFKGRVAELMEERETLLFVDRLLDLYIPIRHDLNIQGSVLNLLFMVLVRAYPNLPLERKIAEKIRTAVDNIQLVQGPSEDAPLELIGESFRRMTRGEHGSEFLGV